MNIPCVLAIAKNPVMHLGVANLASATNNGPLFLTSRAQTPAELVKEMREYEADVILVEKSNLFSGDEALTNLLLLFPKLLVIIVDESSNWMRIFRREDILMTSPADLIDLIQSA